MLTESWYFNETVDRHWSTGRFCDICLVLKQSLAVAPDSDQNRCALLTKEHYFVKQTKQHSTKKSTETTHYTCTVFVSRHALITNFLRKVVVTWQVIDS